MKDTSIPRDEDFDDQIKDLSLLFSVILTMSNGKFFFHVTLTPPPPPKKNQPKLFHNFLSQTHQGIISLACGSCKRIHSQMDCFFPKF